jgi:hypothetical protein
MAHRPVARQRLQENGRIYQGRLWTTAR